MSTYVEISAGPQHRISIPEAPITEQYKAHTPPADSKLVNSGLVQATFAPTADAPYGTEKDDWAKQHQHQTVSYRA